MRAAKPPTGGAASGVGLDVSPPSWSDAGLHSLPEAASSHSPGPHGENSHSPGPHGGGTQTGRKRPTAAGEAAPALKRQRGDGGEEQPPAPGGNHVRLGNLPPGTTPAALEDFVGGLLPRSTVKPWPGGDAGDCSRAVVVLPDETAVEEALAVLRGSVFQGRNLHAAPGRARAPEPAEEVGRSPLQKAPAQFKHAKQLENRRKALATATWNTGYVRADAVVDTVAGRLQVSKADLIGASQRAGNMAVRLAVAETQLVAENRAFLTGHGVDLGAVDGSFAAASPRGAAVRRSDRILLVKNLPASADAADLLRLFEAHGVVVALLLAPSKTVALVEYVDPLRASRAIKVSSACSQAHALSCFSLDFPFFPVPPTGEGGEERSSPPDVG